MTDTTAVPGEQTLADIHDSLSDWIQLGTWRTEWENLLGEDRTLPVLLALAEDEERFVRFFLTQSKHDGTPRDLSSGVVFLALFRTTKDILAETTRSSLASFAMGAMLLLRVRHGTES